MQTLFIHFLKSSFASKNCFSSCLNPPPFDIILKITFLSALLYFTISSLIMLKDFKFEQRIKAPGVSLSNESLSPCISFLCFSIFVS